MLQCSELHCDALYLFQKVPESHLAQPVGEPAAGQVEEPRLPEVDEPTDRGDARKQTGVQPRLGQNLFRVGRREHLDVTE